MFWPRFLLISTAAVCGAFFPVRAQQVTPLPTSITRDYFFVPVGLGSGETASITVVNTAVVASSDAAQPPSCTGTISFYNANGEIGMPVSFTLGSGQFKTVTLPFAAAALAGSRGEIQGRVSLTISVSAPTPCSLMTSMETYDSITFATHGVLTASAGVVPVGPIVVLDPR